MVGVKAAIGQHVVLGVVHEPCQLRSLVAELIGHVPPLMMSLLLRFLGKCRTDHRGDGRLLLLGHQCQGIAHEVHAEIGVCPLLPYYRQFGERVTVETLA